VPVGPKTGPQMSDRREPRPCSTFLPLYTNAIDLMPKKIFFSSRLAASISTGKNSKIKPKRSYLVFPNIYVPYHPLNLSKMIV
jgi:hypothetical protein